MNVETSTPADTSQRSSEEEDNLARSTKRSKVDEGNGSSSQEGVPASTKRPSYKESLFKGQGVMHMETDIVDDDSDASDNDLSDDDIEGPMFSMGISKQDKINARKPWRTSLIVKLVGGKIGYQALYRRLQSMWKIQSPFVLIDLSTDFFIVRFTSKDEYCAALLKGPWMLGDNYLHVQRWQPDFVADDAVITHLPVWVRFPKLPVEYYSNSVDWLHRAGNKLGKTLKVDTATLAASRGRFARVCVEIDLRKPLLTGYSFKGKQWSVQYEGLHLICFHCGKYGHTEVSCPLKPNVDTPSHAAPSSSTEAPPSTSAAPTKSSTDQPSHFGAWMIAEKHRRRPDRCPRVVDSTVPATSARPPIPGNRSPLPATARDKGKAVETDTNRQTTPHGSRFRILTEELDSTDMETSTPVPHPPTTNTDSSLKAAAPSQTTPKHTSRPTSTTQPTQYYWSLG